MGELLQGRFPIFGNHKIKKRRQVVLIRDNSMLGIPLFEFEIIKKRLDNWMASLHKKTIAAK